MKYTLKTIRGQYSIHKMGYSVYLILKRGTAQTALTVAPLRTLAHVIRYGMPTKGGW